MEQGDQRCQMFIVDSIFKDRMGSTFRAEGVAHFSRFRYSVSKLPPLDASSWLDVWCMWAGH